MDNFDLNKNLPDQNPENGGSAFSETNNSMQQGNNGFQDMNSQPYNPVQQNGFSESFTSNPYAQSPMGVELAKKKKPVWLFIVIGLLAIAAILAICYTVVPSFRNSVKMLVLSDDKYYASVEREQADLLSDAIGKLLPSDKNTENAVAKDISYEAEVSVTAGEYLTEELELPKEYTVTGFTDFSMADGIQNGYFKLLVGDSKFVDANVWYDQENDDVYFNMPMYSDEVICIKDSVKYFCEKMEIDASELGNIKTDSGKITEEQVHNIISRYSEIYLKYCNDAKIAKNVKKEAGGLSAEYNMAVVTLTEEQGKAMILEILETAKADEDLIDFYGRSSKSEYQDEVQNMIDTMKDTITTDGTCEIRTYIDKNGVIVGRDFVFIDEEGEEVSFSFLTITEGNKFVFSCVCKDVDSNDGVSAEFIGTLDKDGAFTGKATFVENTRGEKTDFVIDIENLKIGKKETKGKITLEFENDSYDGETQVIKVVAELGKDGDYSTCKIEAFCDNVKALTISSRVKEKDVADISLPTEYLLDLSEENVDISEYIKTVDITELKESIKKEFGDLVSEDEMNYLLDELDSMLESAGSGSLGSFNEPEPIDPLPPAEPSNPPVNAGPSVGLENIKFTVNGDVIVPDKAFSAYKDLATCKDFNQEDLDVSVEADDTGYILSDSFGISVSVINNDSSAKPAKDCRLYSIAISEYALEYGISTDLNGIKIGDDESKVLEVLGTPDEYYDGEFSDTYIYGTYSDALNYQVTIYEGKVFELRIYMYE